MRKLRLFWQIFPVCLGLSLCTLLLVFWLVSTVGRDYYYAKQKGILSERLKLVEPDIKTFGPFSGSELRVFVQSLGRGSASRITVISRDGVVLADSNENPALMGNQAGFSEVAAALAGGEGSALRQDKSFRESFLYVAIPILSQSGESQAVLRMGTSTAFFDKGMAKFMRTLVFISFFLPFLAALLSLFSARRISRPLEEMKHGAEQLATGRFDQPIRINSDHMTVEMAGLARSINQMADQIKRRVGVIMQQRNELEALFSGMADSVVAIDAEKKIIRMNQAATDLFMLSPEAVKGKLAQGVLRNANLMELVDFTLAHNSQQEQQVILFSGTDPIIVQTHAVPLRDENSQSIGVLLVMNDLTKLNRLENIRQDFVANVSHELKTPITVIKGYIETLLDGALEEEETAKRFLKVASAQANRLDAIVDDLLTLSRIEDKNGKNKVVTQFAPVSIVLLSAIETCAATAQEKNMEIQMHCDEALMVPMNQALVEQAIINLLNNAIAYSPKESTIWLRCARSKTVLGEEYIHFSVSDNGSGIAKEHLPRIFERFYRCDKARSRNMGGTGLGLAIVKHIAQAHRGKVDVVSFLDKGSTFTISLPLDTASPDT